jgi:hypothetical protein
MKVFSGNKTVVSFKGGRLTARAGTRTMSARSKSGWQRFLLDNQQYSSKDKVEIEKIVIVRLNDGVREFRRLEQGSAMHTLYPYFLDVVNADTIAEEKVFVGTPPKGAQERLVASLKKTLKKVPVYDIAGSKSFVTQQIAKL